MEISQNVNNGQISVSRIRQFYNYNELDCLIQQKAGIFDEEILMLSQNGLLKFSKNKTIFNLKTESKSNRIY